MFSLRRLFSHLGSGLRAKAEPELVILPMSEKEVRAYLLKDERDFRVSITADGLVTAECTGCKSNIELRPLEPLLWFRCPVCRRVSFIPLPNIHRDIGFARVDGRPFEYGVWWLRDLPPALESPFADHGEQPNA